MLRAMSHPNKQINILGVKINACTIDEAIDLIIKGTDSPRYVVKPYVEFFDTDQYQEVLNQAWLTLPDGVALQWAAHFQKTNGSLWQLFKTGAHIVLRPKKLTTVLPQRFAGTNFTWPLLERAAHEHKTVYLVGSPINQSISTTADYLSKQIPGLQISGAMPGRDNSGVFSQDLEKQLLKQLERTQPDIVLIGIGFPRQEYLAQRLTKRLNKGVFIGEGGTFDYQQFGGQRRKAPRWMQAVGLEWLWRLLLEPSRWRRQLAIPRFMVRVYRDLHSR